MADLLLRPLINIVMTKATDSLLQQVVDMWGISDQRERLYNKLLAVQVVLANAEDQGGSNPAVKNWMLKLKLAAYDADDVLDEFCYEELRRDAKQRGHMVGCNVSGLFSSNNPTLFRYKMSRKLNKVVARIEELVAEMGKFGFVQGQHVLVVNRVRTDSLVVESEVVGRDEDREKIVKILLEACGNTNLTVVPVIGMGGIGKTTLAQQVCNDTRVKDHFELLLWVCVSEEFKINVLIKSIIDLVIQKDCKLPLDNMELLKVRLCQELNDKQYLLVLDDVWNENVDDWERLKNEWKRLTTMLRCGHSGSVIIVTTRIDRVDSIMGPVKSYRVKCLSEEDSWILFNKRAFGKVIKESQELVEIGRKMIRNCGGLPLAINTLGSLMSEKHDVREWLKILQQSNTWGKRPENDNVLPILRLSYDHLSPYMKQCFAFCAIFPKDYEIDKEKLIQYWIANGFIPSNGTDNLETNGNDIFNELVWRSFFQDVKHVSDDPLGWEDGRRSKMTCKMHDLMHDLAQSIMGGECISMLELPEQPTEPINTARHFAAKCSLRH